MKILFLVARLDNASTRQRVLQYRPYLERAGVACEVVPAPTTIWLPNGSCGDGCRLFDTLFIQRRLFQPWEVWLMRRAVQRLVFDFDDAVMFKDRDTRKQTGNFTRRAQVSQHGAPRRSGHRRQRLLAGPGPAFSERVEILPTTVDMDRYQPKTVYDTDRVTIGWIGSRSTLKYLDRHSG